MKKTIGTYFSQYFKMPHLYRDDLEAIEKTILADLKPDQYRLACNGLEFNRLSEVSSDFHRTNVLVMYTHSPCLRLKFARSWAELYSGTADEHVDASLREISQIIIRGERPMLWLFGKYSAWLAPLLGFGSLAIALGLILLDLLAMRSLYLVSWMLVLVSVWWGIGHRYSLHSFSCLDLHRNRSRSRKDGRPQEKPLIFLAGLVLGAISVWLLATYFKAF